MGRRTLGFAWAIIVAGIVLASSGIGAAVAGSPSGPGKVLVGVDATEWDSATAPDAGTGIVPIGGSGQINGEFTTAERNGIQIGLRAQERFVGPLAASASKNSKVGIYEAATGVSDGSGRATWNYDWHVDLRGAQGVAAGTTLADYDLRLETDIADATLFGFPLPLDLAFGGAVPGNTVLYQSSQNPKFGNAPFDAAVEGTYHFRLVLTPVTFNGPPLAVTIEVSVTNP